MKIIIDAMGGDNAPFDIVQGAVDAAKEQGVEVALVGRENDINDCLKKLDTADVKDKISIVNASEVVEMEDDPATVLRRKKDSSMAVALTMLKNGEGDACVSAGSTGALLSGATLIVKRVRGIRRASFGPVLPNGGKGVILTDSGANVECTPEYLLQFAYMGSFYSEKFLGCKKPRVGLLNVGVEETKGSDLQKETFELLNKANDDGNLNFIGNVEAREVFSGDVDVVVTDGFSGNILLKGIEGTGKFIMSNLKDVLMKNLKTKLGALMIKNDLEGMRAIIDPSEVGGTALLGITKPVIKAHGSADARAIKNAINQAVKFTNANVTNEIAENISLMTIPKQKIEENAAI